MPVFKSKKAANISGLVVLIQIQQEDSRPRYQTALIEFKS